MKYIIVIYLIIVVLFSCEEKREIVISAMDINSLKKDFANQTYELIGNKYFDDTLVIDFSNEYYHMYQYSGYEKKWTVNYYNNNYFLNLEDKIYPLKKIKEGHYESITFQGDDIQNLIFIKKPIKFNREQFIGKWIEEHYFNTKISDFPPLPNSLMDSVSSWPPYYEISQDSILSNKYRITASDIEINNTNEFITMYLNDPTRDTNQVIWEIVDLNDSTMIIDRYTQTFFDSLYEWEKNIKLIKE